MQKKKKNNWNEKFNFYFFFYYSGNVCKHSFYFILFYCYHLILYIFFVYIFRKILQNKWEKKAFECLLKHTMLFVECNELFFFVVSKVSWPFVAKSSFLLTFL
jgi:hypothetical protein